MPCYVDPINGDDGSDGLSEAKAWKTLARASAAESGSTVLLKGGGLFPGLLDWSQRDRMVLDAYGPGVPTIVSPADAYAIHWGGGTRLTIGPVRLQGRCVSNHSADGVAVSGRYEELGLDGTEITGYTRSALYAGPGANLALTNVDFHGNGKGTYIWGATEVTVTGGRSHGNDWTWPFATDGGNAGQGFSFYGCNSVRLTGAVAERNGRKTAGGCGPCGFFFQDCDRVHGTRLRAVGNGDKEDWDGQGVCCYGTWDSLFRQCLASDNLNAGIVLFNDPWCRNVERTTIEDCRLFGNICDFATVGNVLGCEVRLNRFGTSRYKWIDFADATPGKDQRDLDFWGNEFHGTAPVALESVPGLAGVRGLEQNPWPASGVFSVRGRLHATIGEALATPATLSAGEIRYARLHGIMPAPRTHGPGVKNRFVNVAA